MTEEQNQDRPLRWAAEWQHDMSVYYGTLHVIVSAARDCERLKIAPGDETATYIYDRLFRAQTHVRSVECTPTQDGFRYLIDLPDKRTVKALAVIQHPDREPIERRWGLDAQILPCPED